MLGWGLRHEGAAMTVGRYHWAVLVIAACLTACSDQNADIFITANIQPTDDCLVLPDGARLFGGALDTALAQAVQPTNPYIVFPLYQNQLQNRASLGPVRADPNGFFVTGAEVQLLGGDGSPLALPGGLPNPYTITAGESTFIPSAIGDEVSAQPGALEIIPSSYVEALDEIVLSVGAFNMLAVVTVYGVTSGDNEIELNAWKWSIRVVRLGLIDFVSGDDLETPGVCDSTETPSQTQCKPFGTDEAVDCRYCRSSPNPEIAACCGQGICE